MFRKLQVPRLHPPTPPQLPSPPPRPPPPTPTPTPQKDVKKLEIITEVLIYFIAVEQLKHKVHICLNRPISSDFIRLWITRCGLWPTLKSESGHNRFASYMLKRGFDCQRNMFMSITSTVETENSNLCKCMSKACTWRNHRVCKIFNYGLKRQTYRRHLLFEIPNV